VLTDKLIDFGQGIFTWAATLLPACNCGPGTSLDFAQIGEAAALGTTKLGIFLPLDLVAACAVFLTAVGVAMAVFYTGRLFLKYLPVLGKG